MTTRRSFVRVAAGAALSPLASPLLNAATTSRIERLGLDDKRDTSEIAHDEAYWEVIQQAYVQDASFINIESGYFSPAAEVVLDAQVDRLRLINRIPSFYMRRRMATERADLKRFIGRFVGLSPDEFVIARNTTEALNNIIQGIPLERGDEVLYNRREYPSMQEALEQRASRYGTVNRVIDIPWLPSSQDEIVQAYAGALTLKTRYILVSHMIYLTGQVLPVKEICNMAHQRGVEIIVDGAHSLAHLNQTISDLDCDYYGTSLHKWLGAPLGTGLMYIRREHIQKVWPLFGDRRAQSDDIAKFEHIGTHPQGTDQTIMDAIRFHEAIGGARKEARLRFLKNYWVDKVRGTTGVKINTPLGDDQSCAIANVIVEGMTPAELVDTLWERHRIFTVGVEQGARIAPNLFTRLSDLDLLVRGIQECAAA
jgi:selenocysteine lyase/cysteine desulfurase